MDAQPTLAQPYCPRPMGCLFSLARAVGLLCLIGGLVLMVSACTSGRIGGSQGPDEALNDLRQSNQQLQELVGTLQKKLDLREAQIKVLNQQVDGARPMPGVQAPRAVTLEVGRYSSAVDSNHDGKADTLRLYLQPRDQSGRFLPVAGKVMVQAVVIEPGQEPVIVGQATFSPQEWDQAYRSGITGTHYSLELPLSEKAIPKDARSLTAKIQLTDAATGAVLEQQTAITLP